MKGVATRSVEARAVSTVLDASLCLLLVTASAVTLAGMPDPPQGREAGRELAPRSADRVADLLATSTARVTYAVGGQDRSGTRTAHDTLAGLLASAARADAGRGGSRSEPANANATVDFVTAVADRVSRALRRTDSGAQVVARWPASRERSTSAAGRVTAGERPPPGSDVHAARLVVADVGLTVRTWSA